MKCWDGSTCLKDCLQSCKPFGIAIVPPNDGTVTLLSWPRPRLSPSPHEYRKPIADDCVAGICSLNNCRYPDCSVEGLKSIGRIIDDPIAPCDDAEFGMKP